MVGPLLVVGALLVEAVAGSSSPTEKASCPAPRNTTDANGNSNGTRSPKKLVSALMSSPPPEDEPNGRADVHDQDQRQSDSEDDSPFEAMPAPGGYYTPKLIPEPVNILKHFNMW